MLSKELIEIYMEELATRILDTYGPEAHIRIDIVGGAAIALNYTFRESTMDIDTYTKHAVHLESMVRDMAEKFDLPTDWMNPNVMVTQSSSPYLCDYSKLHKKYHNVLEVWTADSLTLVCMKSVACRLTGHDMTDIAGILDIESHITYMDIVERFLALYGSMEKMAADAELYLEARFKAMPYDMLDTVWHMMPPALQDDTRDKYVVCDEFYKEVLCAS